MLQIKDCSVAYGPINAVKNISLSVTQGEIVSLIGANGAGKTTLLRAVSGLLTPKKGDIEFLGKSITKKKPYEIVRQGLSHVPERRGIFSNLTVLENLVMGAYTQVFSEKDWNEVYELFPILLERKKQIAGTLSGGEQQMLAIGRALLSRPKLLLLDEPSLGLAPQITQIILDTLTRINGRGTSILLIEQNAVAALKIAHRGYVMDVGKIVLSDTAKNLMTNPEVKRAYLGGI